MRNSLKILTALAIAPIILQPAAAKAATFGDVSHFHNVKVVGTQIYLGTHEGLYLLSGKNRMKLVGPELFDVMGLSVLGNSIIASGHPGAGSKLPSPTGLLQSKDGGRSWGVISLKGQVDFHLLESSDAEIFGGDSQSGKLKYSPDKGKTWKDLGANQYSDIAIDPTMGGMAIAIKSGKLFMTSDVFKTSSAVKGSYVFTQVEWTTKQLLALSGKDLLSSADYGATWKKVYSFKGQPGLLSANDKVIAVTVGSDFFVSTNAGISFKVIK